MKKRALSLLLVLALCAGLMPSAALAAEDTPNDDFVIENGVLIKYTGPGGDVVIPDGVTEIGRNVFNQMDLTCVVTSVVIPDGVTSIGALAFNQTPLTSITIPDSVTSIGNMAFNMSSLTGISIPDSVETIGDRAFAYCTALSWVDLGNGLRTIGPRAFEGCSQLERVDIPDSVQTIQEGAFQNCRGLNAVELGRGVTTIEQSAFHDCSLEVITIPDSVSKIGYDAFTAGAKIQGTVGSAAEDYARNMSNGEFISGAFDRDGNFTPDQKEPEPAPSQQPTESENPSPSPSVTPTPAPTPSPAPQSEFVIDENGVLTSYQGTATDMVIPDGVTEIAANFTHNSSGAFSSITMPNSVTKIGDNAFAYCHHLHTITLSKNLTEVGNNIFYHCDELTNVINQDALGDKKDILLDTRCNIVDGTLRSCDSSYSDTLVVPNGVTRIEPDENLSFFYTGPGFKRLIFPDSLKSIAGNPFEHSKVTEIDFGNGLTSIEPNAFKYCQELTSINLPASIESIGSQAFAGCYSLSEVSIANPDVKIADDAFDQCHLLKHYYLAGQKVKLYVLAKEQAAQAKAYWEQEIKHNINSDIYQSKLKINQEFLDQYISERDYIYTIVTNDVQKASNEACREWTTDEEKVFAIHEWITENIYYDRACLHDGTLHLWTAQEAVETRKAVCNGYAVLFQAMCWAQNIPCVYVTGDTSAGYHAWNAVKIGSEWKWVDCTWDTYNSYSGNGFWQKGATRMYYFLCPTEFITKDHVVLTSYDYYLGKERPEAFVVDGINANLPQQSEEEKNAIIQREEKLQEESLKKQEEAELIEKDESLSEWALDELQSALRTGLVPVRLKGRYNSQISREEFCELMVQLLVQDSGQDIDAYLNTRGLTRTDPFTDTDNANVLAAYALGVVKGTSETTFNPDGQITRQEAATMLARTAKVLGVEAGQSVVFADADTFADWSRDSIAFISGITDPYNDIKVMEGTGAGSFSPLMTYSREQAIITALRLFSAAGNQTIRKSPNGQ